MRIIHRPEEIEGRLVPGHWEGDLIKGAFNRSAVGTVVERKTRYLILSKMRGCTADAALDGFARLNRPGFTGGQDSRRIARYGADTEEEDREAVFP